MKKNALISVFHKEGILEFAKKLVELGWKIFASAGTAKYLIEKGLSPSNVKNVAGLVGGGPILDHRVVTLSREIHAGLLARPIDKDLKELETLGIPYIDLVCVDLYPLSEEISKPDATVESVIENTDIGGPALLRSAAKGGRIVICDPTDRNAMLEYLIMDGDVCQEVRSYLRSKAEWMVAKYCLDSTRFHSKGVFDGNVSGVVLELNKGENLNQSPSNLLSDYTDDTLALDKFVLLKGAPGHVNMCGVDRGLEVLCMMAESFRQNFKGACPYIAIACKHGNPCGAAVHWLQPHLALECALLGDPDAVMGAEVITNFYIDDGLGELLFKVPEKLQNVVGRPRWGVDIVAAPMFSEQSINLLGKAKRRKLLVNEKLINPQMSPNKWVWRPVRGGRIRQKAPNYIFTATAVKEWVPEKKTLVTYDDRSTLMLLPEDLSTLIVAWAVAWRANSNTVVLAKDGMLIGRGVGQQDRRAATRLAVQTAKISGHLTQNSWFASDAFFPFAKRARVNKPFEGTEILVKAQCAGGVVPHDGKRIEEVKAFFKKQGLKVAFLHPENRGFSQH
ncbi:MAG: hypothetical protein JSW41_02165 [Candidatus Aenigmatarchaeota archaeon]|nr:MAG: hypothetical protein JSW41_02165 [Candidatus Aenigmarchaeota archaeon]